MSAEPTSRVHYFDRQFLRVDEFRDEQLYQLALRRRHNITMHIWGIVSGLELTKEDGGAIVVEPGVAIDGYGRELLLTEKQPVSSDWFTTLRSDRLDVWLVYERIDDGNVPQGYGECNKPDGGPSYRSSEEPKLLVEKAPPEDVDPRKPPGVPADVLHSSVPLTSDDPHDTWPVYLGRLVRTKDGVDVDDSLRPYDGIVAATIKHPTAPARVEIGNERFAVLVQDDTTPRIEAKTTGEIVLNGETQVEGNLLISGGAMQFPNAVAESANPNPVIVRVHDQGGNDEVRIDLGDVTTRAFVIGFSDDKGFHPCLRVEQASEQNATGPLITVFGDLFVGGKVVADHLAKRDVGNEAQAAILGAFQAGVLAGGGAP